MPIDHGTIQQLIQDIEDTSQIGSDRRGDIDNLKATIQTLTQDIKKLEQKVSKSESDQDPEQRSVIKGAIALKKDNLGREKQKLALLNEDIRLEREKVRRPLRDTLVQTIDGNKDATPDYSELSTITTALILADRMLSPANEEEETSARQLPAVIKDTLGSLRMVLANQFSRWEQGKTCSLAEVKSIFINLQQLIARSQAPQLTALNEIISVTDSAFGTRQIKALMQTADQQAQNDGEICGDIIDLLAELANANLSTAFIDLAQTPAGKQAVIDLMTTGRQNKQTLRHMLSQNIASTLHSSILQDADIFARLPQLVADTANANIREQDAALELILSLLTSAAEHNNQALIVAIATQHYPSPGSKIAVLEHLLNEGTAGFSFTAATKELERVINLTKAQLGKLLHILKNEGGNPSLVRDCETELFRRTSQLITFQNQAAQVQPTNGEGTEPQQTKVGPMSSDPCYATAIAQLGQLFNTTKQLEIIKANRGSTTSYEEDYGSISSITPIIKTNKKGVALNIQLIEKLFANRLFDAINELLNSSEGRNLVVDIINRKPDLLEFMLDKENSEGSDFRTVFCTQQFTQAEIRSAIHRKLNHSALSRHPKYSPMLVQRLLYVAHEIGPTELFDVIEPGTRAYPGLKTISQVMSLIRDLTEVVNHYDRRHNKTTADRQRDGETVRIDLVTAQDLKFNLEILLDKIETSEIDRIDRDAIADFYNERILPATKKRSNIFRTDIFQERLMLNQAIDKIKACFAGKFYAAEVSMFNRSRSNGHSLSTEDARDVASSVSSEESNRDNGDAPLPTPGGGGTKKD